MVLCLCGYISWFLVAVDDGFSRRLGPDKS